MLLKRAITAVVLLIALVFSQDFVPLVRAQDAAPPTADQLDQLLAPVALYPDSLLAQITTACTDPQEILDVDNWLIQNPDLSGTALTDAAQAAGFDPAFIALVNFPQVDHDDGGKHRRLHRDWRGVFGGPSVRDRFDSATARAGVCFRRIAHQRATTGGSAAARGEDGLCNPAGQSSSGVRSGLRSHGGLHSPGGWSGGYVVHHFRSRHWDWRAVG